MIVKVMFNHPTQVYEKRLASEGYQYIAGVDEVGRGTWAGPIVAGAVIMPLHPRIAGVKDSKQLSAKKRETLAQEIRKIALASCVAYVSAEEIDEMGITAANELVMKRAIEGLPLPPDYVLVDAFKFLGFPYPHQSVPHGDALIYSIAAASIVAKVARDAHMQELAQLYPEYGFVDNKGYGTAIHKIALEQYGLTPVHRKSFQPMRSMVDGGVVVD